MTANIRNLPCPCGSGKKYKHCHGSAAQSAQLPGISVITNPDGTKRVITRVPLDQFGPPFGFKELAVVPGFDEADLKPGECQPTPEGAPGDYEVTFVFSRPELGVTQVQASDFEVLNGDSSLQITAPEPRARGQAAGLRIDVTYKPVKAAQKEASMVLRPNKHRRLAIGVTTLHAEGHRQAREEANRAFLPFLSKLSFENNVPLEVKETHTRELATGGQTTQFRIPFPVHPFKGASEGLHKQEILALVSFYREGMNSTSTSYSFLCFYRILEAIYARRNQVAKARKVRFVFDRDDCIGEADLLGLTKRMEGYREFIGRRFRAIYKSDLTPLRLSIAHGLLGKDDPMKDTPDDSAIRNRAGYLIPITQILARLEIHNELTRKEIPQS
jgi:hypothetical protein